MFPVAPRFNPPDCPYITEKELLSAFPRSMVKPFINVAFVRLLALTTTKLLSVLSFIVPISPERIVLKLLKSREARLPPPAGKPPQYTTPSFSVNDLVRVVGEGNMLTLGLYVP